jgi:transporter family-2 protein
MRSFARRFAVAVFLGLAFVDKIGAGSFNGLLITANLITSLLLDHMGWLGMPERALNPGRALGGLLMVIGIVLVSIN